MRGAKPKLDVIPGGLTRAPKAPEWLPEEARAEWRRVVPGLVERRILTADMVSIVETYCLHVGLLKRAWATITREGEYIGDKRHPAFVTISQSTAEVRRGAAELGLTPTSRPKLPNVPEEEAADAFSLLDL